MECAAIRLGAGTGPVAQGVLPRRFPCYITSPVRLGSPLMNRWAPGGWAPPEGTLGSPAPKRRPGEDTRGGHSRPCKWGPCAGRWRREYGVRPGLVLVQFVEQGLRCGGDVVVTILGGPALDGENRAAMQPAEITEGKAVAPLRVVRHLGVFAQMPRAVLLVPVLVDECVFCLGVGRVLAPIVTGIPGKPRVLDELPSMTQRRVVDLDSHEVVSALSQFSGAGAAEAVARPGTGAPRPAASFAMPEARAVAGGCRADQVPEMPFRSRSSPVLPVTGFHRGRRGLSWRTVRTAPGSGRGFPRRRRCSWPRRCQGPRRGAAGRFANIRRTALRFGN